MATSPRAASCSPRSSAGKDVVTANKALLAVHGEEIVAAAAAHGVRRRLRGERRRRHSDPAHDEGGARRRSDGRGARHRQRHLQPHPDHHDPGGAASSTTSLHEAQRLGLAEANPATDIDGIDSAHKLTLLARSRSACVPRFEDIPTEGIRHIEPIDIAFARELGYTIKLLAIARDGRDAIEARVHPTMIPSGHLLADVAGNFNAIFVRGSFLGPTMYYGQGAGASPTATAVVADLIAAVRDRAVGTAVRVPPWGVPQRALRRLPIGKLNDLESEYYLRFMALDRPGVLARIAGVLGRFEISIASVIQKERRAGTTVPIVIRTHRARERNLAQALAAIDRMAAVRGRPVSIRIEEQLS